MQSVRLSELARLLDLPFESASDPWISGASPLDEASGGTITFADSPKALETLRSTSAAAAIIPVGAEDPGIPVIRAARVRDAFGQVVLFFRPPRTVRSTGVSPAAHISPHARLAPDVQVHAGAVIEDHVEIGSGSVIHPHVVVMAGCRVGAHVTLFPHVVLYEGTVIGDRVIIHAGAVIGAYGFGYEFVDGEHRRAAQLGYVEIESDVEIGAATTIDRGSFGATRIGQGTKIDNQVMVAHNCRIGRHNLICSQVGIAGSSSTGDYVVMAGQVGVPDHIRIGHRAILGAKAGILRDVPDGVTVVGIPATPEREQMTRQAALAKLPQMRRDLKALQRQVQQLSALISPSSSPADREVA